MTFVPFLGLNTTLLGPSMKSVKAKCPRHLALSQRWPEQGGKDYKMCWMGTALARGSRGAVVSLFCSKAGQNQSRFNHICLWCGAGPIPTPPASRALSLEQPKSSLPSKLQGLPGLLLSLLASKAPQAQKHHTAWRRLPTRPINQRARRCLGNYSAWLPPHG